MPDETPSPVPAAAPAAPVTDQAAKPEAETAKPKIEPRKGIVVPVEPDRFRLPPATIGL